MVQNVPAELIGVTVRSKKHELIVGSDFFTKVDTMWASRKSCGFAVDGLIFTPDNVRYEEGTGQDSRMILKWKPVITVDLIVRKNNRGEICVFAVNSERIEEQFIGTRDSKLLRIDMQHISYNGGVVVEFECRHETLVAVKERLEKEGPNRMDHVLGSWLKSTVDTLRVDEDTLLGRNNVLMRKYHNRI